MQSVTQTRKHLPTVSLPAPPVTVAALDAVAEADPAAAGSVSGRVEILDGLCVLRPWSTPLRTRVTQRLAEQLTAVVPSGAHVHPHGVSVQVSTRTLLLPDIVVGPAPTTPRPALAPAPSSTGPLPVIQATVGKVPAVLARHTGPAASGAAAAPGPQPATPRPERLVEPPFLVIEVADENTRRYNRTLKLDAYQERGVPSCWLVDPDPASGGPTVEVYDLVNGAYVRTAEASGDTPLAVTRPFPVTIIPADLVDPGD